MAETRTEAVAAWWKRNADAIFLVLAGGLLLLACWRSVIHGADAPAATLALMGGGSLILAPFASRVHGRFKLGPLEMTLRERVYYAAKSAPVEALEGILPLIETEDVVVRVVELPLSLADHALTDPELQFIRQELQLSVVAVQTPGNARWRAGGRVSEMGLPKASKLLVAGPPDSIRKLLDRTGKSGD